MALLIVAMAAPRLGVAGDAVETGYASLVRRVAPSVVTVMVEEQNVGAGQRVGEMNVLHDGAFGGVAIRRTRQRR